MSTTILSPVSVVPALSFSARMILTGIYTMMYCALFMIVFVQLWMIRCYGHRLLSYQAILLFLSLFWAAIRTILFSFYFTNSEEVDVLPVVWNWVLFSCPICLQFVTLCLLVMFFAKVILQVQRCYHRGSNSLKIFYIILIFASGVIFIMINIASAVLSPAQDDANDGLHSSPIQIIRIVVNNSLFLSLGLALSICVYKVGQISANTIAIETKGLTKCHAMIACGAIIILYTSRAIYNITAIIDGRLMSFSYDWTNVTDQADLINLNMKNGFVYISFGIVVFVWEFLPTFIVVLINRVRMPHEIQPVVHCHLLTSPSSQLFGNRHRYDSEDNLRSQAVPPRAVPRNRSSLETNNFATSSSSTLASASPCSCINCALFSHVVPSPQPTMDFADERTALIPV